MIEANHTLQQAPAISDAQRHAMSRAVICLARQRAIKATQQQLRSWGLKPQHIDKREIVAIG